MKRTWRLQRQFIERQNGQRRWDKAYQLLMEITTEASAASVISQAQVEVASQSDISGESL